MLHTLGIAAALGTLGAALFSSALYAAMPTAADRAWIDTCMSQRKSSKEAPARLRKYCACMQQIVEDNQPFENATALERDLSSRASDVLEGHWRTIARRMG